MTCLSLAFWWYLVLLQPPTLVARFPTEAACQAALVAAHGGPYHLRLGVR
jgi:hypothetical protein